MPVERAAEYNRVRRAYELGRFRSSAWRAALVSLAVGIFGLATAGRGALLVLPFTSIAWLFAFWRGTSVLRGAAYGLMGGIVTSVLPMSILRPCCAAGAPMTKDCCTMPGACLAAGAFVGVVLAGVVPFGKTTWWQTALGVVLGMTSIAVVKCSTLFAGETVGLVGGLVVGSLGAACARVVIGRRTTA